MDAWIAALLIVWSLEEPWWGQVLRVGSVDSVSLKADRQLADLAAKPSQLAGYL